MTSPAVRVVGKQLPPLSWVACDREIKSPVSSVALPAWPLSREPPAGICALGLLANEGHDAIIAQVTCRRQRDWLMLK